MSNVSKLLSWGLKCVYCTYRKHWPKLKLLTPINVLCSAKLFLPSFFQCMTKHTCTDGWSYWMHRSILCHGERWFQHGSWNLILDISVMTFACSWEECGWQSGDNLTTSCCESCRPSKHKNENVTWKALLADGRWCRLAPLGSAALCGSVFSGLKITHLPFSSVFFFFFRAVEVRRLSEMLSITVVCHHIEQFLMPGTFFFSPGFNTHKEWTSKNQQRCNRKGKIDVGWISSACLLHSFIYFILLI